jgi:ubiquitin C-terminal hydrolase
MNASNYKLYGISHHSGTLDDGQYFAEVMDLDSENWFKCND